MGRTNFDPGAPRVCIRCILAAAAVVVLLFAAPATAQIPATGSPAANPLSDRDSARVVATARSAQARFERIRRNHLPWTFDSWGGDCDEIVGRFCLRHGDDEDDWESPPEPGPVREARDRLLDALDAAAAQLPGDGWIAGQRVRYLTEADSTVQALTAASACRPVEGWWCTALVGYAHHTASEWERSDSAFSAALAAMPDEERKRWTDVSVLLRGGWREYDRAPATARDSLERRFWWLADPFWMIPGNDRRTEHFARLAMDRLQERSESTESISRGSDTRELLLRYGWGVGWERVRPRSMSLADISIVSHHAPKGRRFTPPVSALAEPHDVSPADWPLKDPEARSEYSPPYASSFEPLDHQLALFRVGEDSMAVVVAYELADTLVAADDRVEAALILAADELTSPLVVREADAGPTGVLRLASPSRPTLLSLETLVRPDGVAGRARYAIRPPTVVRGVPGISDLLLLTGGEPLPQSLKEATVRMRRSNGVRAGERIVIYWELYDVGVEVETMRVSLSLRDADPGWLRRLGQHLGVAQEIQPIRLSWLEGAPSEREPIARSLEIELPPIDPGRYTLELTVTLPGREPLVVTREIQVTG